MWSPVGRAETELVLQEKVKRHLGKDQMCAGLPICISEWS